MKGINNLPLVVSDLNVDISTSSKSLTGISVNVGISSQSLNGLLLMDAAKRRNREVADVKNRQAYWCRIYPQVHARPPQSGPKGDRQ